MKIITNVLKRLRKSRNFGLGWTEVKKDDFDDEWPMRTAVIQSEDIVYLSIDDQHQILYVSDGRYLSCDSSEIVVFSEAGDEIRHIDLSLYGEVWLWKISGHYCFGLLFDENGVMVVGGILIDIDTGAVYTCHFINPLKRFQGPIRGKDYTFYCIFTTALVKFELKNGYLMYHYIEQNENRRINSIIYDGQYSMLLLEKSDGRLRVRSLNTSNHMEWRVLIDIRNYDSDFNMHMVTPSLLCMSSLKNEVISYNFITGEVKDMEYIHETDIFPSPDGSCSINSIDPEQPKQFFMFDTISHDGSKLFETVVNEHGIHYAERKLKVPFRHPVYTHIYEDHRWIRLMSDLTLETHDTRPSFLFLVIGHIPEAIAKAKERAPGGELTWPIIAWAYNLKLETPFTTVEKAKRSYFASLVSALSKEIGINSIK